MADYPPGYDPNQVDVVSDRDQVVGALIGLLSFGLVVGGFLVVGVAAPVAEAGGLTPEADAIVTRAMEEGRALTVEEGSQILQYEMAAAAARAAARSASVLSLLPMYGPSSPNANNNQGTVLNALPGDAFFPTGGDALHPLSESQFSLVPGIPGVTLVCDSITASVSKCGFEQLESAGDGVTHYYLRQTTTYTYSGLANAQDSCYQSVSTYSGQYHVTQEYPSPPGSCNPENLVTTCSDDAPFTASFIETNLPNQPVGCSPLPAPVTCNQTWSYCQTGNLMDGCNVYRACFQFCLHPTTRVVFHSSTGKRTVESWVCSVGGDSANSSLTTDIELDNEYTTTLLEFYADQALPAYSGFNPHPTVPGQGSICGAFRALSQDETTLSIGRFKYKFTIPSALNYDLEISWAQQTFSQPHGGPPIVSHETMSGVIPAGSTETSVFEVLEPDENSIITVLNVVAARGNFNFSNNPTMDIPSTINQVASNKGVAGANDSQLAIGALVVLDSTGAVVADGDKKSFVFPTSDPHVLNAAYWSNGVLVQSNG